MLFTYSRKPFQISWLSWLCEHIPASVYALKTITDLSIPTKHFSTGNSFCIKNSFNFLSKRCRFQNKSKSNAFFWKILGGIGMYDAKAKEALPQSYQTIIVLWVQSLVQYILRLDMYSNVDILCQSWSNLCTQGTKGCLHNGHIFVKIYLKNWHPIQIKIENSRFVFGYLKRNFLNEFLLRF